MSDEARRWIWPDPVTDHIYDPESLNKYSYARNDPVNLVDVDGRFYVEPPPPPSPPSDAFFEGQIWLFMRMVAWPAGPMPVRFDLDPRPDGRPLTPKERKTFLASVLGENGQNVADRIGDQNSLCWKYLQGLIDKLGLSSLSSPKDLIQHLNDAVYELLGDRNGTFTDGPTKFGPNGSIWAEATTSGSLGTGSISKVTLGWKFFNSNEMNPSSVLMHEAFHLFSGKIILDFNVNGLSDSTLFSKAGVNSAKEFNQKIDDNCK